MLVEEIEDNVWILIYFMDVRYVGILMWVNTLLYKAIPLICGEFNVDLTLYICSTWLDTIGTVAMTHKLDIL